MHEELYKLCPNSVIKLKKNGIMDVNYKIVISNNKKTYRLNTSQGNNQYYYQIIEKGLFELYELVKLFGSINKQEEKIIFKFLVKILKICIEKIECLHNNGYLHRDIKPENIIILKGTQKDNDKDKDIEIDDTDLEVLNTILKKFNIELPKLIKIRYIDFGFLYLTNNVESLTSDRKVLGTKMYMKKNVFNSKYNYMTDLFALARMYQELITNHLYENSRYFNLSRRNYNIPSEEIYLQKKEWFSAAKYQNFKKLSKSLIPLQEHNEINKITCLNGQNREQSYKAMTDVLEEIVGLITP